MLYKILIDYCAGFKLNFLFQRVIPHQPENRGSIVTGMLKSLLFVIGMLECKLGSLMIGFGIFILFLLKQSKLRL